MLELDQAIAAKQKQVAKLKAAAAELARAEADLEALLRTKELLAGKTKTQSTQVVPGDVTVQMPALTVYTGQRKTSIVDAVEELLRDVPEMHADEIVKRLRERPTFR